MLGAAFCALSALGYTMEICVSQGCSITREVSIAGVSFYWFGMLAFMALLVCWWAPVNRKYVYPLAGMIMAAETGLLLWQICYLPCTNCLIVALLFGVAIFSLKTPPNVPYFRNLRAVYAGLFSVATVLFMTGMVSPIQLGIPREEAGTLVYFSPASEEGRAAALRAVSSEASACLIPVVEDPHDINLIVDLREKIARGQTLTQALTGPCLVEAITPTLTQKMIIKYRSFLARVELLRFGVGTLPITVMTGRAASDEWESFDVDSLLSQPSW